MSLDGVLIGLGYRAVEDVWTSDGRITYVHDDDADRAHLADLRSCLLADGWDRSESKLRSFVKNDEEIEIEPGGSDVSGHFLHLVRVS